MEVYLVTEKSDFAEDLQFIFEDYDDAKAYVHDEIDKFRKFVTDYPDIISIDSKYEKLSTRFEEPVLDSTYIGTLFVDSTCWDLQTPIATIKVSKYPVMIFDDCGLRRTTPVHRSRPSYISYNSRRKSDE